MKFHYYTADVFTDQIFGGNPLAVFPNAQGLSTRQMQLITREFNLSETAFVLPPQDPANTRQVRIFTPAKELPFAGHPTIGTAFVLSASREIELVSEKTTIILEEGIGPIPVTITQKHGEITFCQLSASKPPEFGPPPPPVHQIAEVLSLDPTFLLGEPYAPQAVSCGVPFLFVGLQNRELLAEVRINYPAWQNILSDFWATEIFVFCFDPERPDSDLRARMFAPAMGIAEDPATGAAATALGGYLGIRNQSQSGTLEWVVEQGFEMGRPSILKVETDKREAEIVSIRVGGQAVLVSEGWMEIADVTST